MTEPAVTEPLTPRAKLRRSLRAVVVDGVAPVAAYFGLRALGVADLPALVAGGAIAALDGLASVVFQRRPRALPLFVTIMFAASATLACLTHDPRVVLLKASIVSGGFGLYLLAVMACPHWLEAALSPLIARGSPERAALWDAAWASDAQLRRTIRLCGAVAGLALIAEATARAAIICHFTIGQSLFLMHAPALLLVAVLVLLARLVIYPAVARVMQDPSPP